MENQNALTPTRIQLKHSPPTMGGFRTTVSTSSEWMESNTKEMWFYPPRTECITHWDQHHDLEWQKARGDTFKLHGKCTMIVVTTMVRFSTEESLETCGSRIFTNREYSFQYPICKEKTVGRWGIPTGWRDKKWACRRDKYYRKLQWRRLIKITRFPEACCLYPKVQLKQQGMSRLLMWPGQTGVIQALSRDV